MTRYWNVKLGSNVEDHTFTLTCRLSYEKMPRIDEGDLLCLTAEEAPTEIARVARCRIRLHETEILLDRRMTMQKYWMTLWLNHHKGVSVTEEVIVEADPYLHSDSVFCQKIPCVLEDVRNTPFEGQSKEKVQRYIRDMMVAAFEDEMAGPAQGPRESVYDTNVTERYLVGCLPPKQARVHADNEEILAPPADDADATRSSVDDEELKPSPKQSLLPSSIGLSFMVKENVDRLKVAAEWGRYTKSTIEKSIIEESHQTSSPSLLSEEESKAATPRKISVYKRDPHEGGQTILLIPGKCRYILDPLDSEVTVEVVVREHNDTRLVTIFLVNGTVYNGKAKKAPVDTWIFQPRLQIEAPEGKGVFIGRDQAEKLHDDKDEELKTLDMLYRRRIEFATGHAVSVHAVPDEQDPTCAVRVETRLIPKYEVAATETPGLNPSDRPAMQQLVRSGALDMVHLAELSVPGRRTELIRTLKVLADDYEAWIEELLHVIEREPEIESTARIEVEKCKMACERLNEGIETLESDDLALKAFGFANQAMARQRVRSIFMQNHPTGPESNTDIDAEIDDLMGEVRNHSWRPFQLAFFLLLIPSLANPTHEHRTDECGLADLLWFPTGGGKTEAYLGAAAFAMAVRRLQPSMSGYDSSRGLTVIMRYTLRLLTMQQFQRASTLICAMETMREEDPSTWGEAPFTIGIWVGGNVTPNDTKSAAKMVNDARKPGGSKSVNSDDPAFQIARCPWCGTPLTIGRNVKVDTDELKTHIFCSNIDCDFGELNHTEGLPLLLVDEEIYRRPPSMLIATVDKFAQMPLNGAVRTLFGLASKECPRHGLVLPDCGCGKSHAATSTLPAVEIKTINSIRPPDLIIQDEFHLISGPLGTMVGLYETAIDDLCSWDYIKDGEKVRIHPKIVASTATVRRAGKQMFGVFYRGMQIFPPSGLNIEDNFFAVQRPIAEKPGRLYLGICSPGSSKPPVLIRTYVTLLTSAEDAYQRFGELADPFMTLVGYFSALRELGGMRRLADDDVRTRVMRVEVKPNKSNRTYRPGMKDRPLLAAVTELTSRMKNSDIPKCLEQIGHRHSKISGASSSPDIVLATNMLSVGVDVPRLGLMAVNGQPKNTAEYIQATSRVGRSSPGLVCTAFGWSRARDLSHYETFEHYHATFYKHVEAQSVTPFSSRALDRGLSAVIVSDLRLKHNELAADSDAKNFDPTKYGVNGDTFSERAWKITDEKSSRDDVADRTNAYLNDWGQRARQPDADLSYSGKQGRPSALISASQTPKDHNAWIVPNSMREVEPNVNLVLDRDAARVSNNTFEAKPNRADTNPTNNTGISNSHSQQGDQK